MAKTKLSWKMKSYGIYSHWDRHAKDLPRIKKHTTAIPAYIGVEFGYILNIKKAKGKKMITRIEHPPFKDDEGTIRPAFVHEVYVRSNDWNFYLGDTIWEPVWDKLGDWQLVISMEGQVLADKTFILLDEADAVFNEEE